MRPGATLHARPPAGAFVYPADDDRPLVLIAGGVGITPLISMARHAVAVDPGRPVALVQSARAVEGLAFASELRVLHRRHPRLQWVPAVTSGSVNGQYYAGRIDGTLLRMAAPDIAGAIVCLCGPNAMIHDLRGQLLGMGLASSQVRFERFEAAVAAIGAQRAEALSAPAAAVDDSSTASITFARSQVTHAAEAGDTVLDAAEACGVEIPTLCRAGVCGTCRTRLLEGDVECGSTALDPEDRDAGFVLACVAQARTDCVVEA